MKASELAPGEKVGTVKFYSRAQNYGFLRVKGERDVYFDFTHRDPAWESRFPEKNESVIFIPGMSGNGLSRAEQWRFAEAAPHKQKAG